jgi:predicted DCC family thiol-disulfide oxidoreductase YuxK
MFLLRRLQAFLFRPVSAKGFGLMRIGWAGSALAFFLAQWKDIAEFYSSAGVLPYEYEMLITRHVYRFTLLDSITEPTAVFAVYLFLLACLLFSMLGVLPRLSTILSFILLCSFHERNPLILGGGDTVLRIIGFLLCVSPTLRSFSVSRVRSQWRHWKFTRALLPDLTASIWAYRLLLWQMIVIYGTSVWYKGMGMMWKNGTAVTAALQHEIFVRWPREVISFFILGAPFITYLTIAFEAMWLMLLIPRSFTRWLMGWEFQPRLKRWLILAGIAFHGGIFVLMDVGSFSIAMMVGYFGLLIDEDFEAMKRWWNRHGKAGSIRVFYDGHCGLCLRSVFWLELMDWLGRLKPVDFRDADARKAEAPDLSLEALDRALHVRFPAAGPEQSRVGRGDGKTLNGFDAFRALAWHLPPLWVAAPFLYLPGIPPIGRRIYARIAARRQKCKHEDCAL